MRSVGEGELLKLVGFGISLNSIEDNFLWISSLRLINEEVTIKRRSGLPTPIRSESFFPGAFFKYWNSSTCIYLFLNPSVFKLLFFIISSISFLAAFFKIHLAYTSSPVSLAETNGSIIPFSSKNFKWWRGVLSFKVNFLVFSSSTSLISIVCDKILSLSLSSLTNNL